MVVSGGKKMAMYHGPLELVLVRHGESEGNLAQRRSDKGDDSDWRTSFSDRHTSRYRLTDEGRKQAVECGKYIQENISPTFDYYFTSEYVRAQETAALLDMPNANWVVSWDIRELDKGVLGGLSKIERAEQYAQELRRRARDVFFWEPPGGESLANMCLRIDRFLHILEEECSGLRVLVVCHGNIMEGFRLRLESMTQRDYLEWQSDPDPRSKINNCQIFHYTRRNPHTSQIHNSFKWFKSICPWDPDRSYADWRFITRKTFSSAQLLKQVQEVPQLVNEREEEIEEIYRDLRCSTGGPTSLAEVLHVGVPSSHDDCGSANEHF